MSATQETELIFIPFPMISHLVSTIQLATLLTQRDKSLTITFLMMKVPADDKVSSYIDNIVSSSNNARISFVELPPQEGFEFQERMKFHPMMFSRSLIQSQIGPVRSHVAAKMGSTKIGGFVIDVFCTGMLDVADEFNIPTYVFLTSGFSGLGLWLSLQAFADDHKKENLKEYEDSDFELSVPTYVNPIPARVWPGIFFDEDDGFLEAAKRFRKAKGIVVNTFLELESHAVESQSQDLGIPPVYPVGPILHVEREESHETNEKDRVIVSWLDDQPDSSVVYICFGSAGFFEADQVKEIATALENSGQRFLWSLRKPPPPGEEKIHSENPGEELLPLGFLDRTDGVGKVIGWAPQMTVLSHKAVGGFVSHCGWNSTLESVWCGVPMAAWPLFAEQRLNAFLLVKELGMAVEIKMESRKGGNNNNEVVVGSDKIEKAVREVMDLKNDGIRAKVRALKEKSRLAMVEGGSSHGFLRKWIDEMVMNV